MGTTELFRFRIVRPVLQQPSSGLDVSTLVPPMQIADLIAKAREQAAKPLAADAQSIATWLAVLSTALARAADLISPAGCVALLPEGWDSAVCSADWTAVGSQYAYELADAVIAQAPAPLAEYPARQLLVFELVATLASDEDKPAAERTLKTAADVRAMVGWRHVILPRDLFGESLGPPMLARRPGVTDFYVVHDEWSHYEAGELAAVINVLPGETLDSRIRHFQEVDTLTSTTTSTTTFQLTEQDQTQSTSLSQSSTKDASLNIGVQGQVEVSGQYGPTHVATSLGAQLQVSQTQSDSTAMTTSVQTVQRAVKSVSQTVTNVQSQRTVTRDATFDERKLQNTGQDVTVGLYRWLNEVHYVQLVKYPNRFVLEFEIPEPGAWLRWALQNTPTADWDHPYPGPFRLGDASDDLSPADISADSYHVLAKQWRVQGLTPPPPQTVVLGARISLTPPTEDPYPPDDTKKPNVPRIAFAVDDSITVPDGYQASTWSAQLIAYKGWGPYNFEEAWITVGAAGTSQQTVWEAPNDPRLSGSPAGANGVTLFDVGDINTGTVPISVYAFEYLNGFTCNVAVTCTLQPGAYAQWQQTTFDLVASAYEALLNAYYTERDTRNQQLGGLGDLVGPPELNQARATGELRRMVIQDLLGTLMGGTSDVKADGTDPFSTPGEPYTPALPLTDTDTIQFFEQALEWENIVYLCYPYYWARHVAWIANATSATSDPVFDQFLNAGSARVVVPARPGFENLVLYYLYTGRVWAGSQPPAPDDPDYLSVAEEIQSLQQGPTDGTPVGSSWAITLPTTLLWAGTDPATLPANPSPTIPKPTS